MLKLTQKPRYIFLTITIAFLAFVFLSQKTYAYSCSWKNGAGSTAWTTAANWDSCNSTYPQTTDDVTINIATANQPILDLSGGNVTINSLSIGSSAASTLTLSNGFTNELIITNNLTVGGSGTITHTANTTSSTHAIRIQVGGDMSIASGGYVNANSKGLSGGAGGGIDLPGANGNTSGAGGGNGGAGGGGGGGYGGAGGAGASGGAGGIEHDQATLTAPVALGSGGGGGGGTSFLGSYTGGAGGAGGGAIKLAISGTLTLNSGGFIRANGNVGSNSGGGFAGAGGGGSGGSIWISAGTITGFGTVSVIGGNSGTGSYAGGGGAGGRIVITYTSGNPLNYTSNIYGGTGNQIAASGSIYTKQGSASFGDLTFNNNSQNSSSARTISSTYGVKNFNNLNFSEGTAGFTISASAEFNVYGRIITNSTNDTFSTAFSNSGTFSQNSAAYTSLTFSSTFTNSGGTITLPNLTTLTFSSTNGNTGTITANSLTTLNVNGTSTNSGTFTANSLQSFNITGANVVMDTLYSNGTSRYVLPSTYAMTISSSGTLRHSANGATALYYLNLSAASFSIDGTSKIDVSGLGLTGGAGGAATPTAGSNGNISGSGGGGGGPISADGEFGRAGSGGGGGGHGGAGGVGTNGGGGVGVAGAEHDSGTLTQPNALGSGGGGGGGSTALGENKAGGAGGNGGGSVKLNISGTLTINSGGYIYANGNNGTTTSGSFSGSGGGGSGGSVWISVGSITGSGAIQANGGNGNTGGNDGGGGAGGRVSLTFATDASYGLTNTATGGTGANAGANGSIYYNVSASYTSSVVDFTLGRDFTTLSYNKTTTADAISTPSLTVDARAGNTDTPDGTWTAWSTGLADDDSIDAFDNYRYTQYRINLASNNAIQAPKPYNAPTANPLLSDISFNYNAYLNKTLTSSSYNANSSSNLIGGISWDEDLANNTNVKFQLQTSANGTDWSGWKGPDGTDGTYFDESDSEYCTKPEAGSVVTCTVDAIPADFKDGGTVVSDQYFQYKAFLTSSDELATPTLNSVTVTYVVNANPEFETVPTAVPNSSGNVDIAYSVRDKDSETNTVTPSFQYSLNGGSSWTAMTDSCLGGTDLDAKAVAEPAVPPENTTYTAHSATWDMSCEIGKPGSAITTSTYEEDAQVRVTVDDGQAANQYNNPLETGDSINFTLDTKSPVITGLTLDASVDPAEIAITSSDDSSYQMRTATGADLTACQTSLSAKSYETYDATPTIDLNEVDPSTICVQLKDQYNNISTISSTDSPETPTAMMVQD
ncbi:MAG TPA: hypothetical protein P5232_02740, partial [Candidatus Moranbacteria bacterium]|nr:hypothetical protein [Candidatus Moranbacteria bacterium]